MSKKHIRDDMTVAFLSNQVAVMGADWYVNIIYRRVLATAYDSDAQRRQFTQSYTEQFLNPTRAAELGFIDEVIQPRELRSRLCGWLEVLDGKRQSLPRKKHGNIPL